MKHERLKELYRKAERDNIIELKEALDEVVRLHVALEFIAAWQAGAGLNGSALALASACEETLGKIQNVNAGWRR